MVMETPSPQCVGREFVRQYYTLLNEAPHYLHRFYSHNSSFLHGGNEKNFEAEQVAVIGQNDIHKKIMSLNFHDCHAKIRYVDSQATIGTGVVVQVTGELSNSGKPLRRFMQTFVLAPQTANKYYVHNDIFRYQDEVFDETDEEIETDGQSLHQVSKNVPDSLVVAKQPENLNNQILLQTSKPPVAQQPQQTQGVIAEAKVSNGHSHHMTSSFEPITVHPPAQQQTIQSTYRDPQFEKPSNTEPAKTKTSWADTVEKSEKNGTLDLSASGDGLGTVDISQIKLTEVTNSHFKTPASKEDVTLSKSGGNRPKHDESTYPEDKRPERKTYPDNQQIFVGNLAVSINELELKDIFKSHGVILDVRIHKNYLHNSRTTYGFVVFNDVETTQKVLALKTIEYKSVNLNIEEKRPRSENKPPGMHPRFGGRDGRGGRDGNRPYKSGRGGFNGPSRDENGGRTDQRRFSNSKPTQQY